MHSLTRRVLFGVLPAAIGVAAPLLERRAVPDRQATPAVPGNVPPLLSLVPAASFDAPEDPAAAIVQITDLAAELDHAGITIPADLVADSSAPFYRALSATGTDVGALSYSYTEDLRSLQGFDIRDVDQVVLHGPDADQVTLLAGRLDADGIGAALSDQGYALTRIDTADVWNRGADYEIDFDHPMGGYWLAGANYIAMLGDGRLACAASADLIRTAVRTGAGDEPALGDDPRIVALYAADPVPLVSALFVRGDLLDPARVELPAGWATAGGPLLPPIALAAFGTTPGNALGLDEAGDPDAAGDYPLGENQVRVRFRDPASTPEGRDALTARLDAGGSLFEGGSWIDLFGTVDIEADTASGVIVLHLPEWLPGQRGIIPYVVSSDVGFLAWEDGD